MKLKNGYITHASAGEHILVSAGDNGFAGLVRSNDTAAFLVELLKQETTEEQLVEAMLREYDVSRERVTQDVRRILEKLRSIGALEE